VHFQGRVVLRKAPTLDPEIRKLGAVRPDFIRIEKPPFRPAAMAYRGWTWARRHRWMPARIRRIVDDQAVARWALSPLGLLLDAVLVMRRRLVRPRAVAGKRWQVPA
jgi:hypothetical protein